MNKFLEGLTKITNLTETDNGAVTNSSTLSGLYDYFATCGAMRAMSDKDVVALFENAYNESKELAIKLLFYSRDIRGGQGERRSARTVFHWLGDVLTESEIDNLLPLIVEYGRWDDVFALFNTKAEKQTLEFIKRQYVRDLQSEFPSLLGKWMKKESQGTQSNICGMSYSNIGTKLRKYLVGQDFVQYRKSLSQLRKQIGIVEHYINNLDFENIDYSKIPSQAMLRYRELFYKKDEERFSAYIEQVKSGKKKMNTKTLVPAQIVGAIVNELRNFVSNEKLKVIGDQMQIAWDNIPDYLDGSTENILPIVDVSGSMYDAYDSINSSIALGLYASTKTKGSFANHFVTFSETPELVKVNPHEPLTQQIYRMAKAEWGNSTNLEEVFNLLIETQQKYNIDKSEMPTKLIIISDMQFNRALDMDGGYYSNFGDKDKYTLIEKIKQNYESKGLTFPDIVFWNVRASADNFAMTKDDMGSVIVSGSHPMLFEYILKGKMISPLDIMTNILESPRYKDISI